MTTRAKAVEKWLFLAPAIVLLSLIMLLPFGQTLATSLTDAEISMLGTGANWVGLENYAYTLTDPYFGAALARTLYFTVVSVGLRVV